MDRKLTVGKLLRFLAGDHDAILAIAAHPASLWIGILLVVSGSFARNYDQEDLLHEPWHLGVGLAVAIVNSFVLYGVVYGAARLKKAALPGFVRGYRAFLSLFLCMAPMAWLYATPYERMMEPYDAAVANMWTLAVVSAWRVLLTSRMLGVLFSTSGMAMFFVVMLFADIVALIALAVIPVPVFNMMGGMQHSPVESLLASTALSVQVLGTLSLPIWIIGVIAVLLRFRPAWGLSSPGVHAATSMPLKALLAASLVLWVPVLPSTQLEQQRRWRAEHLFKGGDVAAAIQKMSRHPQSDYPPHWDPPPRQAYREKGPSMHSVREALESFDAADWVRDIYLPKIERELRRSVDDYFGRQSWTDLVERFRQHADSGVDPAHVGSIRYLLKHDATLTAEDRTALELLLAPRESQETLDAGGRAQPARP